MPVHELLYFDGPGRAETIRICLHAANIDFTDTRFAGKDWPSMKLTTPLGSVPVLKIDGIQHVQSVALARYAGKLGGLYPDDPLQALCVDEAMDTLNELMAQAPKVKDPEELKTAREEFQKGVMTKYATFLEKLIQTNGGGVGFASTPSIADIALKSSVESVRRGMWDHIDPKFFESYEGIVATVDAIAKNEKVVAYYASKK
jgi:glutathione S-transferase